MSEPPQTHVVAGSKGRALRLEGSALAISRSDPTRGPAHNPALRHRPGLDPPPGWFRTVRRDATPVRPMRSALEAAMQYVDLTPLTTLGRLPEPPTPDYLRRTDGAALLYRGRVNRLFGDPESGKTWVLLAAAGSVLAEGGRVAHVDVDHMGAALLVGRLGLLGVPLPVLGDPGRFRMYEPTDGEALRAMTADVAGWSPDLVGVDSLGEVLPMLGLSSNSPDDYTEAHRAVIQPLADSGACVVVIDHLAKSSDSRRQGPGGTLAKGRPVRGVSLRVRRTRDYAPGKGGASVLSVDKDTPGGVRAVCPPVSGGEASAGLFRLAPVGEDPAAPGSLGWAVDSPTPADLTTDVADLTDERAEVDAAVKLSRALGDGWLSQTKARQAAKVGKSKVAPVLLRLAAGGYVESRSGERGAVEWRSVKPFAEADQLPEAVGDDA